MRTGIAMRPVDLDRRLLAGGGQLAGIGFTMALFVANQAFRESRINSAKQGVFLASGYSAVAGIALLIEVAGHAMHAYTSHH